MITKIKSFIVAIFKWSKAGFPTKKSVAKERHDVCKSCYYYNRREDICNYCGCNLKWKTAMMTERCPIGKW